MLNNIKSWYSFVKQPYKQKNSVIICQSQLKYFVFRKKRRIRACALSATGLLPTCLLERRPNCCSAFAIITESINLFLAMSLPTITNKSAVREKIRRCVRSHWVIPTCINWTIPHHLFTSKKLAFWYSSDTRPGLCCRNQLSLVIELKTARYGGRWQAKNS
jgi:hypothetical protein